jgi:hypothetical protein
MKATHAANVGEAIHQQPVKFTSTYKHVKATIVSVLMWLSMVGGLL